MTVLEQPGGSAFRQHSTESAGQIEGCERRKLSVFRFSMISTETNQTRGFFTLLRSRLGSGPLSPRLAGEMLTMSPAAKPAPTDQGLVPCFDLRFLRSLGSLAPEKGNLESAF